MNYEKPEGFDPFQAPGKNIYTTATTTYTKPYYPLELNEPDKAAFDPPGYYAPDPKVPVVHGIPHRTEKTYDQKLVPYSEKPKYYTTYYTTTTTTYTTTTTTYTTTTTTTYTTTTTPYTTTTTTYTTTTTPYTTTTTYTTTPPPYETSTEDWFDQEQDGPTDSRYSTPGYLNPQPFSMN